MVMPTTQEGKNPVWSEKNTLVDEWYAAKGGDRLMENWTTCVSLMNNYGVSKPIMLTEAGICSTEAPVI
jgi:hypothetical protein